MFTQLLKFHILCTGKLPLSLDCNIRISLVTIVATALHKNVDEHRLKHENVRGYLLI